MSTDTEAFTHILLIEHNSSACFQEQVLLWYKHIKLISKIVKHIHLLLVLLRRYWQIFYDNKESTQPLYQYQDLVLVNS